MRGNSNNLKFTTITITIEQYRKLHELKGKMEIEGKKSISIREVLDTIL